jgi:hypothetical protein
MPCPFRKSIAELKVRSDDPDEIEPVVLCDEPDAPNVLTLNVGIKLSAEAK